MDISKMISTSVFIRTMMMVKWDQLMLEKP